jgi:hypothetical protein
MFAVLGNVAIEETIAAPALPAPGAIAVTPRVTAFSARYRLPPMAAAA